jgi:adenosylhomocysteinase
VPRSIDEDVARVKLATMGVRFDTLTNTQRTYVTSFDLGT